MRRKITIKDYFIAKKIVLQRREPLKIGPKSKKKKKKMVKKVKDDTKGEITQV